MLAAPRRAVHRMRQQRSPRPTATRGPASDADLRREHRRLLRAFAALVCAIAPGALTQACESSEGPRLAAEADGGTAADPDAGGETDGDAALAPDARPDAAPTADADASAPTSCTLVVGAQDASADGDELCFYTLPCGLPKGLLVIGCDVYTSSGDASAPLGCSLVDGDGCEADAFAPGAGGQVTMVCPGCLGGGGRRPRGLARLRPLRAPTAEGAYFAVMAHDEAASVHAFRRLRDELALHGAPPALVQAAERAARDEERHARVMARHARLRGATMPAPRLRRAGPRALEAVARENAVEGCVRETFGALLLRWQATHARDASVRRTLARIASDEARHAALSWAVARWAEARLDAAGRARVARARARAVAALAREARSASFDPAVGRPDPAARAALLHGMVQIFSA
jgi:hypothetical protein